MKFNKREFNALIKKIEASKKIVAAERDKIRELSDELDELFSDWDDATDGIEFGIREIKSAVETISKLV